MSVKISRLILGLAAALTVLPGTVLAGELTGTWERGNGKARIRFEPCGAELCAVIAWIRPDVKKGKVGQTVFRKLKRTGDNSWTGEAFNPEDGRTYKGSVDLKDGKLHTKGCALGGLICKSDTWTRVD
jgi:uncharacterized protein (DUF2147 family)